jgi:Na+/H+ antiporter NhaD/arsenite permease-like protein
MRKLVYFISLLAGTLLILCVLRDNGHSLFSGKQLLSIGIFSMFIFGTLLFGEFRLAFAFGGIALLMACNLLTVQRFTQSASLDVIVFLIGTFLVIGYLEESRFFEHVVSAIVTAVGPRPQRLLLSLMIMASLSSALVGEVTAILFMAGAMLHLTGKYKLNPIPFIIMLVFACNFGSAMSSVGNPIGVLISLKTGLSFVDFLKWAAPTALIADIVTYFICRWWYADAFASFASAVQKEFDSKQAGLTQSAALSSTFFSSVDDDEVYAARRTYQISWVVLLSLILLLVTHRVTEKMLDLHEGTMMVGAALLMGSVVLFLRRERARDLVERRIDWWTLSFFMMLFASVGTLEDTHVTQVIADRMNRSFGDNHAVTIQIIGWATGWLSAFLDNVLAVATFMPVVHDVRARAGGEYSSAIYWMMLFGGTFMGNMTIIGSTANIVACGLLEKRGHGSIKFGEWFKIGFIVSIASMLVASMLLWLQGSHIPMLKPPAPEMPLVSNG